MSDKAVKFVLSAQDRASAAINGLRSNMGKLGDTAGGLNNSFGKLGVVFGSAFAGASLTAFIRGTASGVDRLNDLKDATGASIENLSALEDVGARTGTSFESVSSSLVKFNKVLSDADPGSANANIFKKLGLDAQELKKIDPAEALRQAAVALARFGDDGDKARIVYEFFGKSIKEAAPFLNDLATQTRLVGTVTEEQAREAEKFNQQLFALQKNSTDAARAIVGQLLPALNNIFEAYKKLGGVKGIALAVLGLDEQGQTVANAKALQSEITRTGDAIARMQTELERNPDNEFLKTRIDKSRARLAGLIKDASSASEKLKGLADAVDGGSAKRAEDRGFVPEIKRPGLGGIPGASKQGKSGAEEIDDSRRALAAYIGQLDKEREKTRELSDEQKALNFLKSIGTTGEIPQVRELVLGLAAQNDELEDQLKWRKLNADAANDMLRKQQELNAQIDEFSGRTGDARKRALTAALEARLAAGETFSPEELDRIVRGIGGVNEELEKSKSIADELGLSFSSAFEDAIVGGNKLSEVLQGLEQDILRIITRKLVTEPLAQGITGFLNTAGGSSGGIGGILGNIGSLFGIPSFDVGTDFVPRDMLAMVHKGERITPAAQNTPGGGGSNYITINVPPGTDRQSANQMAAQIARRLTVANARNN
jgi:hypothetical protein